MNRETYKFVLIALALLLLLTAATMYLYMRLSYATPPPPPEGQSLTDLIAARRAAERAGGSSWFGWVALAVGIIGLILALAYGLLDKVAMASRQWRLTFGKMGGRGNGRRRGPAGTVGSVRPVRYMEEEPQTRPQHQGQHPQLPGPQARPQLPAQSGRYYDGGGEGGAR